MSKLRKHLKTVRIHRKYVRQACWKCGLFWQGLIHDLSKYSLKELSICKYYTDGTKSPHQVSRDMIGYSPSWIVHYHKNKHHPEFWQDDDSNGNFIAIKMPYKYVIEAVCDMLGASRAYNRTNWKPETLLNYFLAKGKDKKLMHKDSYKLTEMLLRKITEFKELNDFFNWYNKNKKVIKFDYETGHEYDNLTIISAQEKKIKNF